VGWTLKQQVMKVTVIYYDSKSGGTADSKYTVRPESKISGWAVFCLKKRKGERKWQMYIAAKQ